MSAIVDWPKIIEVSKRVKDDKFMGAEAYFDAGSEHMLREMARVFSIKRDESIISPEAEKHRNKTHATYEKLHSKLPEEFHDLLLDYDDACHDWVCQERTDHYIEGFLAAYRFFNTK